MCLCFLSALFYNATQNVATSLLGCFVRRIGSDEVIPQWSINYCSNPILPTEKTRDTVSWGMQETLNHIYLHTPATPFTDGIDFVPQFTLLYVDGPQAWFSMPYATFMLCPSNPL